MDQQHVASSVMDNRFGCCADVCVTWTKLRCYTLLQRLTRRTKVNLPAPATDCGQVAALPTVAAEDVLLTRHLECVQEALIDPAGRMAHDQTVVAGSCLMKAAAMTCCAGKVVC